MSEVLTGNNAAVKVREIYQNILDERSSDPGSNVLIAHLGSFTLDFVSGIIDWLETIMVSAGDKRIVIKRMLTILIEGLKNVRKHGEYDPHSGQLGFLMVSKTAEEYHISIANLVQSASKEDLTAFIEKVNAYSEEELPVKLHHALESEFVENGAGAGLGMIITRIKTGRKLHYYSHEINRDLDLFIFEVSLSRIHE